MSIEREIFKTLFAHLEQSEITVLIGARQVGKTTLLDQLEQQLLQSGVKEDEILRFNLDLEQDFEKFSSQQEFLNLLKFNLCEHKQYVFVDEVQRIENAGKFFKGIYDQKLNIKFVLTGSSSLEIRSSISESLAGRKKIFNIYPFSFGEFLRVRDAKLLKVFDMTATEIPQTIHRQLLNFYHEYLVFGGYPKVVLSSNIETKFDELAEIYQSYLDKDIVALLKVGDRVGFHDMLKSLAFQLGSTVEYSSLASDANLSVPTLQKYLNILAETFVVFPISPYFTNVSTEIKKAKKYYFYDNGLRNYILANLDLWDSRQDQGQLFENAMASMLKSRVKPNETLHFWRTKSKAEIDFVLDSRELIAYEAKLKYHFTRSYRSFMDSYKLSKGYLLNLTESEIHHYDNYQIESLLPWQFKLGGSG